MSLTRLLTAATELILSGTLGILGTGEAGTALFCFPSLTFTPGKESRVPTTRNAPCHYPTLGPSSPLFLADSSREETVKERAHSFPPVPARNLPFPRSRGLPLIPIVRT